MMRVAAMPFRTRPIVGACLVRNAARYIMSRSTSQRQWQWVPSSSSQGWKLAAMALAASALGAHTAADCKERRKEFLARCDAMYERGEYAQLKEALEQDGPAGAEELWRLARAIHGVSDKSSGRRDAKEQRALIEEALGVAGRALEAGGDCSAAHKWYGILLNRMGDFQGTKAQIQNSFAVRDHWARAVDLDPADPTARSLLGEWCMAVAGLSFVTRRVAAAVFASPPSATFGEALNHFEAAEEISPGFWLKNRINIAKCALQVGDKAKAKGWLEKVIEATPGSGEDEATVKEAREMLARMG